MKRSVPNTGRRVRAHSDKAIYLVDRGYLRHIPNEKTYNNLFSDRDDFVESKSLRVELPFGKPISKEAFLARLEGDDKIYLVEKGIRRRISSPAMKKYHFDQTKVREVPRNELENLIDGPPIE